MENEGVRKLLFRISLKLVLAISIPVLLAVSFVTAISVREFAGDKTKYVLYVLHLSTTQVCKKVEGLSAPEAHLRVEDLTDFFKNEFNSMEFSNNYLIRLKDIKFLLGDPDLAKEEHFLTWLDQIAKNPMSAGTSIESWGKQSVISSYCRFGHGADTYASVHVVSKQRALEPVRQLAKSVVYVALIVLIFSLLLSYFLAKSFSRPIATLAEASDEIAAGNFSHQWSIANRDEIGLLSDHLERLRVRLRDREAQLEQANDLANKDHLTKLWNRRFMEHQLEDSFNLAARYDRPMSLIYFDLDHFKSINDTYGHQAGDMVLAGVGELMQESVRKTDFAGRVGGEEFIVLLPETDAIGALAFAKNLRQRLKNRSFRLGEKDVKVTVSMGISTRMEDEITTWKHLISTADEFAYKSKKGGRDRINYKAGEIV